MRRHARRDRWLASALAVLAGYVDAIGFLYLDGLFVSFMSGNSTQLAVQLTTGSAAAWAAVGLIGGFVAGVVVGTIVATVAGAWRKPAVIAVTAVLLAVATMFELRGVSVALLAAAMGVVNCVFLRDGEVSIGITYMTGTLVKLGQGLAATLTGRGATWAWVPYLVIWSGLVAGAVAGSLCYVRWGPGAMSGAVALAVVLTSIAALFGPADPIS